MKGKTRRSVVVLAVVAMIAALLAVPVSAGATTPATASYLADYSACPDGVIPASGFADSTSSFAKSSIDCIGYYGISNGTSATTFDPASAVTREQMALFLTRAAGPAGITLGAGADQGFTDIAGLSAESQTAINQLAELGITRGTSATTFNPAGTVIREQMALFINRFLGRATAGPGGMYAAANASTTNAVDFTDIGGVTFEAHTAILNLFELGVTTGTTATTFSPLMSVTREQMAAFIGRALAHTNARPAGLVMQTDLTSGFGILNPNLSITYRDSAFVPAANVLVDIFRFIPTTTVTSAFKTDGTCVTTGEVTVVSSGANACKIDLTDAVTNANGNISWGWSVPSGKTGTFYAWTGAAGATFDNDTTTSSSVTVASSADATAYGLTTDIPVNAALSLRVGDTGDRIVKDGTSVTLTVQLTDGTNPVAKSGVNIIFTLTTYDDPVETAVLSINSTTVMTDAAGKAVFTVVGPSTGDVDNTIGVAGPGGTSTVELEWSDDAAIAWQTTLAASSDYVTASATGAANSVLATTYDQYGSGLANQTVAFTSDDVDGIGATPVNRTTNGNGEASLSWTRASAASSAETVAAAGATSPSPTVKVYWTTALPTGATYTSYPIAVKDVANKTVVISAVAATAPFYTATWDAGDQFNVAGTASTLAAFETEVGDTGTPSTLITVTYSAGVSVWDINP